MAKLDRFIIDNTTYELVPEIATLFNPATSYSVGDCVIYDAVLYKFTANHAAGAWTGNDAEAIEVADRLNKISDSVAPEFSTSASYTAGSYVYKNGVLYRFTSAHSGAWTGTDARIVTIGGDICKNSEIFEQHEKEYIDFSMRVLNDATVPNDFIYGRYLSAGFADTTTYARNKYPYPPGKYEIGPTPISSGFTALEYISDTQGNALIGNWVSAKQMITPTRPWYITFNGMTSEALATVNANMVVKRISEQEETLENTVNSAVAVAEEALDNFEKEYSKNRYDGVYFLGGGYVVPNSGTIASSSTHTYTSWFDISNNNGKSVVFSKVHSANASFANLRYAFYKEDKTFISGDIEPTLQTDDALNRDYAIVQTPSDAVLMRFSFPNAGFSTEQYWQVEYTEPTAYSVYTRDYSGIKTSMIDENEIIEKVSSMTYGIKPEQATAETLTDGQTLVVENNSIMKNQCIAFFAKISGTFSGVYVGHGKSSYGYYIKVDGTNMTYCSNGSEGTVVAHGLTITDFIGVCVEVDVSLNVKVTITTSGGYFTKTQQINSSWRGDVFAESISTSFTDAVLTWHSDDYKCPVWAFGDSYFTLYSVTRWPYYVAKQWGFNNILLNAYPGEDAANGYRDFVNALKHGKPKYVIWCEGMNNADSSTAINASWLQTAEAVRDICAAYGITLIFTTIPIVTASGYNNAKKNEWIRNSGIRYVDFAVALENVDGWLSSDNVHPSEIGGRFMALKLLSDVPEIYQGK